MRDALDIVLMTGFGFMVGVWLGLILATLQGTKDAVQE